MNKPKRKREQVIGSQIDAISWNQAISQITDWALRRESRYVCICNVHSVVTARDNPDFQTVINNADMATPDGFPVAWLLRRLGHTEQDRINGPDLMLKLCEHNQQKKLSIYLYGSTDDTLQLLQSRLKESFPNLDIAGSYSPPFRTLTEDEEMANIKTINDSGAHILFVGLGCPKQEIWMAKHKGNINAVMLGVGAAFDYHAGTLKRAPVWMQNYGLEWFYRLVKEPTRLWRRYLVTNSIFIFQATRQLLFRSNTRT